MALRESTMMELGTKAPNFTLPDVVSGKHLNLYETVRGDKAKAVLVLFICNHCPYVIHVQKELVAIADHYRLKGLHVFAISSNDVEKYPADAPDRMREHAADNRYSFPYLYDESQDVARDYDAACTPDLYLFDGDLSLAYRGRLDESRPGSGVPVTGKDLRYAIDAVLAGEDAPKQQYPSAGCGIKWKA